MNYYGSLGDGTTNHSQTPVAVTGLHDAVQIDASSGTTCALRRTGQVVCWGYNNHGELGNGSSASSQTSPVPVSGLADAAHISAGVNGFCAVRIGGRVVCWGARWNPLVDEPSVSRTPTAMQGVDDAIGAIASSGGFPCAIRASSRVACWGANWIGDPQELREIDGLSGVIQGDNGCSLLSSGRLRCWGWMGGPGTVHRDGRYFTELIDVPAIEDAVAVSGGQSQWCGLKSRGTIACWDNTMSRYSGWPWPAEPRTVANLTGAVSLDFLHEQGCAVLRSGQVACWIEDAQPGLSGPLQASLVPGITDALTD